MPLEDHSCRGMLREQAPRSDEAKQDPPSSTGAVTYEDYAPAAI